MHDDSYQHGYGVGLWPVHRQRAMFSQEAVQSREGALSVASPLAFLVAAVATLLSGWSRRSIGHAAELSDLQLRDIGIRRTAGGAGTGLPWGVNATEELSRYPEQRFVANL